MLTSGTGVSYTVERLDVQDRDAVVRAYESARETDPAPSLDFGKRYDWLYIGNPAGPAEVLVLRTSAGHLVGMLAVVPRRYWAKGRPFTLGILCDFIVHKSHRTFLPALRLQRAARQLATASGWGTYGVPNIRSLPVLLRLGDHVELQRPRLARVVHHHDYLARRSGTLARLASRPLDTATAVWELAMAKSAASLRSEWLPAFDDRFDDLWRQVQPSVCMGDRSAEFLSWRFQQEPGRSNKTVGVFEGGTGRLAAYAVGELKDRTFEISDLLSRFESRSITACLALIMQRIRGLGVDSVSLRLLTDAATSAALARLGFRPREYERIFIHAGSGGAPCPGQLTRADEDV